MVQLEMEIQILVERMRSNNVNIWQNLFQSMLIFYSVPLAFLNISNDAV